MLLTEWLKKQNAVRSELYKKCREMDEEPNSSSGLFVCLQYAAAELTIDFNDGCSPLTFK